MRQLSETIWVLEGPNNIGFYVNDNQVTLIDSGNDKEAGKRVNKILKENNWELKTIINTHSNADHIGGNNYLQRNTNCEIYASKVESALIEYPELEKAFLWGGYEVKELRNKFFCAKESVVTKTIEFHEIVSGFLEVIPLKGHFFNMIGIKTEDHICFLADSLFGKNIIDKYGLPYIYDIKEFIKTLQTIAKMDCKYFVPSHGTVVTSIDELVSINLKVVERTENFLLELLKREMSFEVILQEFCNKNSIKLNPGQYALVGSTIKSFLSYMAEDNLIEYFFENNMMLWKSL